MLSLHVLMMIPCYDDISINIISLHVMMMIAPNSRTRKEEKEIKQVKGEYGRI